MRHKIVDQMIDATLTVMASRRYTENADDDLFQATQIVIAICEAIHDDARVYIPSGNTIRKSLQLPDRNQEIKRAFDGRNYNAIAKHYGLTNRQIRRILHG